MIYKVGHIYLGYSSQLKLYTFSHHRVGMYNLITIEASENALLGMCIVGIETFPINF